MAPYDILPRHNESEEDHLYRLMGNIIHWVFDIEEKDVPNEPNAKALYQMYKKINEMPTKEIQNEYEELIDSADYKSQEMRGCWCRTWCAVAEWELHLRDERKEWIDSLLRKSFNVHKNPDGSVVLT